jgi:hypothetical protein
VLFCGSSTTNALETFDPILELRDDPQLLGELPRLHFKTLARSGETIVEVVEKAQHCGVECLLVRGQRLDVPAHQPAEDALYWAKKQGSNAPRDPGAAGVRPLGRDRPDTLGFASRGSPDLTRVIRVRGEGSGR